MSNPTTEYPRAAFRKGTWRHYTMLDGLAHNSVWCIYTDPMGYLWIGTEGGGISRFDGARFLNFTRLQGLSGNTIKAIYRDPDGVLWIGTWETGLSRYDGRSFINFDTSNGLPGDKVWAIHRDRQGRLWLGTDGGICRVDGDRFVRIEDDIAIGPDVLSISEAPDGTLYFGRGSILGGAGLSILDGDRLSSRVVGDGSSEFCVMALHAESRNSVWIGTGPIASDANNGHLLRYDGEQILDVGAEHGLGSFNVREITPDPARGLWFSTWRGVFFFDGERLEAVEQELPCEYVNAIHIAEDGVLWFGTGSMTSRRLGGLSRYEPGALERWEPRLPAERAHIRACYEEADGTLWLATSQGLLQIRADEDAHLFSGADVCDVHRAQDGSLWLATWDRGIECYSPEQVERMKRMDRIPCGFHADPIQKGSNRRVMYIHEDTDGTLWFGTQGGLMCYREGRLELVELPRTGYLSYVTCIHRDRHGTLWVGGVNGLHRMDGDGWHSLLGEGELPIRFICCIHEDDDGTLWFGSYGEGVVCYDGARFRSFAAGDGLPTNHIRWIMRDRSGLLWVSTEGAGVMCYDGTGWAVLDTRDGLAGNTVSCIFEREGALWFGTDRGITRYRPNRTGPIARIVAVTAGERYTDLTQMLPLIAGERVTFEYTSIDFKTHPSKRLYRYRLEGYDRDWSAPTRACQVDYAELPLGEYRFCVQAIDRDLNYSEPAMLSIRVQEDPRELRLMSLQTELQNLQREVGRKYDFQNIVGRSAPMKRMYVLMERVIDSKTMVLISGETGTGKGLVAKAIHYNGPRKNYPLQELNCGAMPKELIASILFGHRRGTFTGADQDRPGLFEAAAGGTLILDEISEMPEETQVHLLRVLQENRVRRLGETQEREVDVRVIAITNRDLMAEVRAGTFREDLYYRLSVFPIHVPSLRERLDDIPLLADHFLQRYSAEQNRAVDGLGPGVIEMLQEYPWPGNIRELENEIQRAMLLVEEGLPLQAYHFSPHITQTELLIQDITAESLGLQESVDRFRRRLIEATLRDCDGNQSEAARRLGIHRPNLIRLMKRLGIRPV